MPEKEYIEREAALNRIKELQETNPATVGKKQFSEGYFLGLDEAEIVLLQAPTADVAEVKHGEWLDYADSYWKRIGRMDLRCSVCGKRASEFVANTGAEDWWDNWKPNYCPNCGAKMDGAKND